MKTTADRILDLMRSWGFRDREIKRELAETCGLTYQGVQQWFGTTKEIGALYLLKIARKYCSTVDWLLLEEGPMRTDQGGPDRGRLQLRNEAIQIAEMLTPAEWSLIRERAQQLTGGRFAMDSAPTQPATPVSAGNRSTKSKNTIPSAPPVSMGAIKRRQALNEHATEIKSESDDLRGKIQASIKAGRGKKSRAEKAKTDKKAEGDDDHDNDG